MRALDEGLPKLTALETFLPKFDALQGILDHLERMERRMPDEVTLVDMARKLSVLDATIAKIEAFRPPETVMVIQERHNGKVQVVQKPDLTEQHNWNRMKMLTQFVSLAGKAREIELEWQKIQQAENDAFFAFQSFKDKAESEYIYKKGIADGIKWCVNRFS